ncbi:ABC transporter substrate-binding protein [Paenibacillus sp. LHD-117]|uniref:ABC transporter substrate-binding protein n=1 Tax=Paenibacillus sp. LHD-117 TaxID=3071412 RepID=UPI0027E16916|nr:ABC transporter substrate-binding protein [Paenibacillus sp. LHD-117]MDQ6419071.1 ABC transporter substrate-binding protein [Paenibacillus sp. LHD-117]
MPKKPMCSMLAMLLLSVALAGCAAPATEGNGQELRSDKLIVAIGSEPEEGFDPTLGWGRYGSPLFQSTLLKRDDNLNVVNDLAESYEVSEDGLEWTVNIRGDVTFTDGQPLTAEDVKYTFETAASSGAAIDLTNVKGILASGNTIVFKLGRPQSTFLNELATLGIVPKHAHGSDYASKPIGSGPFNLVQWDRGQQLIVESNPDYYGDKPSFRQITFLFLSEDAALAAAKAGTVDMAYIPSAFSNQQVEGMRLESLRTVDNRGIVFPYVEPGALTVEGYPIGNAVTSDAAIRKAINMAIDRKGLVDGILHGYGTPAYTAADGLPWWNEETTIADGDIDGAKALLAEAGWADADGDGIVEKNGVKAEFPLIYPSGDTTRQSLALAASEMAKEIGIKMTAEGKSWEDIDREMHASAVLFGWGSHDPSEIYVLHASKYAGVDYYNTGYYQNDTVDNYMDQALAARTEEEAMAFWKKSQWDGKTGASALGDAPWAWLVNINHLYLVDEALDIGTPRIQPHGHGWPVTDNIASWKWKEQ